MLVQTDGGSSPVTGSRAPSILDSPTLARVERARLRHETGMRDSSTFQSVFGQLPGSGSSSSAGGIGGLDTGLHAIKRGLLWQQRDRLFSRWKERYFILTRDYLHCFKRASGNDRISDMGHFIFKIKLVDVERVEWHNKKTYSTVSLDLGAASGGGRILLRAAPSVSTATTTASAGGGVLEDWFELLEECSLSSKERRRALMHNARNSASSALGVMCGAGNDNGRDSVGSGALDEWLLARRKTGEDHFKYVQAYVNYLKQQCSGGAMLYSGHCDSVPDLEEALAVRRRDKRWMPPDDDDWNSTTNSNRLSLLTDIDIAACNSSTGGDSPPSVPSTYQGHQGSSAQSYRLNQNVFLMTPQAANELRYGESPFSRNGPTGGSFRSQRASAPAPPLPLHHTRRIPPPEMQPPQQIIRYRERSYSDIQRLDRRPWLLRTGGGAMPPTTNGDHHHHHHQEPQQRHHNGHLLEPAQS